MKDYIYFIMLIVATILMAVNFSFNKLYQKRKGTSPKAAFMFNSLFGLFTATIYFVANGFKVDFSLYSLIMTTLFSICVMSYTVIGFKLLKTGTMAVYTLFLMVGGMVVPYIFGLIFLDEEFSTLRTFALIVIMAGVVLANYGGEKISKERLLMCIAVFLLNGMTSVLSKIHQIDIVTELEGFALPFAEMMGKDPEVIFRSVAKTDFVILGGIVRFVIAGVLFLLYSKKAEKEDGIKKAPIGILLLIILGSAAVTGVSSILQLEGASNLPATVIYPVITGGTIIFSSISGMAFFKDKISYKTVISIALCFIGTLMFL